MGSDRFTASICIYPEEYEKPLEFFAGVVLGRYHPVGSVTLERGTYEIPKIGVGWEIETEATNVTLTIKLKSWEFIWG